MRSGSQLTARRKRETHAASPAAAAAAAHAAPGSAPAPAPPPPRGRLRRARGSAASSTGSSPRAPPQHTQAACVLGSSVVRAPSDAMAHRASIAFGSNLGDRAGFISQALRAIGRFCTVERTASLYESPPAYVTRPLTDYMYALQLGKCAHHDGAQKQVIKRHVSQRQLHST